MGQRDLNTLTYWQTHADNTLNTPTFCHSVNSHTHTLPSQNTHHLPPLLAVNGRAGWERSPGLPPLLPEVLQPSLGVLTLSLALSSSLWELHTALTSRFLCILPLTAFSLTVLIMQSLLGSVSVLLTSVSFPASSNMCSRFLFTDSSPSTNTWG